MDQNLNQATARDRTEHRSLRQISLASGGGSAGNCKIAARLAVTPGAATRGSSCISRAHDAIPRLFSGDGMKDDSEGRSRAFKERVPSYRSGSALGGVSVISRVPT